MNELQWRELVGQTKNGDKEAFEKLYRLTERLVDTKNSYAGFYGYYKSKVGADNAQDDLAKSIKDKGFTHAANTFMLMWDTLNGEVSIGATQYKTSEGRLGMLYWSKNQTAQ